MRQTVLEREVEDGGEHSGRHSRKDQDVGLATALLYGIRSDTQDLGRETTQADIDAFLALYPQANKRMLSRIEHERVPDTYYRALSRALADAEIHGNALVADLGPTGFPSTRSCITEWSSIINKRMPAARGGPLAG